MTTVFSEKVKCPICESEIEIYLIGSTNRMGAPDLDLRPPEMMRSTMNQWTHECPNCSYVSCDFTRNPTVDKEFLESDFYQSCDGFDFKSDLAKVFYREFLIESSTENKFYALLHCAWACDDADDSQNACKIRRKSLDLIDFLIENDIDRQNHELMKADLMRRSRMFDEVIQKYSSKDFGDDTLNRIAKFQVEKSCDKDTSCYTLEDINSQ